MLKKLFFIPKLFFKYKRKIFKVIVTKFIIQYLIVDFIIKFKIILKELTACHVHIILYIKYQNL